MSLTPQLERRAKDNLRAKKWYENNRERKRIYDINYRQTHQDKIKKHRLDNLDYFKQLGKKWYNDNREYKQTYSRIHTKERFRKFILQEIKNKMEEQFELSCFYCGKHDERAFLGVSFHEIHGKEHQRNASRYNEILSHPQDFIPICPKHHKIIHTLMKKGRRWNQISVEEVINYSSKKTPLKRYLTPFQSGIAKTTKYRHKIMLEAKPQLEKIFDLQCCLCGGHDEQSYIGVSFHEIHGIPHGRDKIKTLRYILNNPEFFVPLCRKHHIQVHHIMKKGFTWKEIKEKWDEFLCL